MKRRKLIYDILFCWGVPVFQVGIHYVVSVGRYSIEPIWGCADGLDNSWPFIVFYYIPNPIFTLLSGYYAGKSLAYFSCIFSNEIQSACSSAYTNTVRT